jgi:hypothetical protein
LKIKFLSFKEIDFKKWDKCVDASLNGTIFGQSWYLNLVSESWDAIILDDYDAVMPIPVNKILKYPTAISPCLAPQLGVFSPRLPSPEIIDAFLSLLRSRIKYIKIGLNKYNLISDEEFKIKTAGSFSLDLIHPYSKLCQAYSRETKQIIDAGLSNKVSVSKSVPFQQFIQFYQNLCTGTSKTDDEVFYDKLRRVISFTMLHRFGELFGAYSEENNLTATAFVIRTSDRITLLISAMHNDQEGIAAYSVLLDQLLKEYAEKNVTIDFEILPCPERYIPGVKTTSDKTDLIHKIATLYTGFGAKMFNYPIILYNKLPWYTRPYRRLKRITSDTTGNIQI